MEMLKADKMESSPIQADKDEEQVSESTHCYMSFMFS